MGPKSANLDRCYARDDRRQIKGVSLKPVLGLFDDENGLRDELAKDLSIIEPELVLIDTNYPVESAQGASGALDILAKDRHGSYVIIEVKRSDTAARQALHELSKYLAAFMTSQAVDEHKLRCFVVSTLWHELDVPLSYFASTVNVDVKGFEVSASAGKIKVAERVLPPINSLPKLCPDTRFVQVAPGYTLKSAAQKFRDALALLPFVRGALLEFEAREGEDDLAVLCLWRVAEADLQKVHDKLGTDYLDDEPVDSMAWREESGVLDWLLDQCSALSPTLAGMQRGTPEKIASILLLRPFSSLAKLGSWSKKDVNDLSEMQRRVVARDVSSSSQRANRYEFKTTSSPGTGPSWKYTSAAFCYFVDFESLWRQQVERFLADVESSANVSFYAEDPRHFQFRIYQHLYNSDAQPPQFRIDVSNAAGVVTHILGGGWAWDGKTCPADEKSQLIDTYGSLASAFGMLFSSIDDRRYESALRAHGFYPFVIAIDTVNNERAICVDLGAPADLDFGCGIERFVANNAEYCQRIFKLYEGIPAIPNGKRQSVLIEVPPRH